MADVEKPDVNDLVPVLGTVWEPREVAERLAGHGWTAQDLSQAIKDPDHLRTLQRKAIGHDAAAAFVVLANAVGLVHIARAEKANELGAYSMLDLTKTIRRPKFSRVPAGDGWSYSKIGALIHVSGRKVSHLIKIAGYRGIPARIPAAATKDRAPQASEEPSPGKSNDAAGHAMMAAIRRRISKR